jgi:hypothetical protein
MLKTPYKKDNKFISLSKDTIKLSITDVKIKGIKKLLNCKGYSLTLFISNETNKDTINDLIKIDNDIADEILKESNKWFGKSFEKSDVDELYTKSFCNQTKTINVILTNKDFNNINYNNNSINDVDKLIYMLKENNNYKKSIINLSIEYMGLYFYSEYTSNKWLIKSLDITELQNDSNEWHYMDDIIEKIDYRIKKLDKNTKSKISQYNKIIEEYKSDYYNIANRFKDKDNGNTKDINNILGNINELLILQEEKINRLL